MAALIAASISASLGAFKPAGMGCAPIRQTLNKTAATNKTNRNDLPKKYRRFMIMIGKTLNTFHRALHAISGGQAHEGDSRPTSSFHRSALFALGGCSPSHWVDDKLSAIKALGVWRWWKDTVR